MGIVYRNIDELKKHENNPRTITSDQLERLKESIVKNPDYFEARPIVVSNRTGELVVIAGNQRLEASMQLGLKEVPTYLLENLTEEREREIMIRDNVSNGEWDMEKLMSWDSDTLLDWGVEGLFDGSDDELFAIAGPRDKTRAGSLIDRFIIPPFSILDAKQGRWQERKRAWLSLGIKSEEGRDKEITYSRSAQNPAIYEVRNRMREKLGYDPSWDEITEYCKKHDIPMLDGTSVFDPVLCELAYRWFNIPAGVILDPFAGGSVRGIVAAKLGMRYRGVDLRPEQIKANYENAAEMQPPFTENDCPIWKCGDSREIDQHYAGLKADMIFSCPPYADLEVYSDDPRDLSNMEYEELLNAYKTIIQKSCSLLKENRFAVFVIGEVRGKNGAYYNFVGDTINAFLEAGLHYYNEMILATQIGSLAMRVTNQFNHSRKIGKTHQNVLVFFKGDLKQIPSLYPELDFKEEDFLEKGESE